MAKSVIRLVIVWCFWVGWVRAEKTGRLTPTYVADQLLVHYVVDLMPRAVFPGEERAPSPADVFGAAGVTVISDQALTPPEVVEHLAVVQIGPGARFGETFRALQRFLNHPQAGWRLRAISPNHRVWLDPQPPGDRRVFNMSARAEVRTGFGVTIGGLVVPGTYARLVVLKVRGPSLAALGVEGGLQNPKLRLHAGAEVILENDDWGSLREWEITLARSVCPSPDDAAEAMIVTYLDPGAYTAMVSGADGGTGIALLEIHLVDEFVVE